jgi:hypothetical protein
MAGFHSESFFASASLCHFDDGGRPKQLVPVEGNPLLIRPEPDARILLFTLGVTVLTGLVFLASSRILRLSG